ncbi:tetratricopeptide repeat protein, partial [Candidatus Chloroploca sp. Khr17]|uniref:tetratricopeptide repeat protein n=1 Tax=Candidatus Chloroploca sp. Khr17 TaxID=2496869 RepID=UPI00101DB2B4
GVLVTRGDLGGAMGLYEQSLAIKASLGDVRGKSATLVMMAQIRFVRGEHDRALSNARESFGLLQAMGAVADAAQVAEIIQQMEAAMAGGATPQPSALTPAQLVGALTGAVVRVLRGQLPGAGVQADLARLSAEETLTPSIAALLAAIEGKTNAAATLLTAAEPLLAQGTPAERADALVGIGNLAAQLNDGATELRARQVAVAAFREAGDDQQNLVNLSIALYNLAIFHAGQEQYAAAIPLLEEVVALDERTGHPDLASDRAKLEAMRQRAAGVLPVDSDEQEAAVAMEAMLSQLTPAQQAEFRVLSQVVPLLQQGIALLRQPGITAAERGRLAAGLEQAAQQAEAGEVAGSPWLAAAAALRTLVGWLHGTPPHLEALEEPYRSLVAQMVERTDDE